MTQNNLYFNFLKQNPEISLVVQTRAVMTAYRGSVAHNLYVAPEEENGTDDIDIVSITVPSRDYYFPVNKSILPKATQEFFIDQFDIVAYEFSKFVYMLTQCNPNTLSLLWLQPEHYLYLTENGGYLIENRSWFPSRANVYNAFTGYAYQQLKSLEVGKTDAAYMGEKRRKLVEKYGYDTRHASHLIRLLKMGIELLDTGDMEVFRIKDRDELLHIKNGGYKLEEIKSYAQSLFEIAKEKNKTTSLQAHPNMGEIQEAISEILHDILNQRYVYYV